MNGIRDSNFIPYFSAYFISFWLKIMSERGFLTFWIFLLSFSEFSSLGWVWAKFGSKFLFFFSFSAYQISFWLKIMPKWGFLIFWILLLFFSEFSCPGRVWTDFETKFFFHFLGLSNPVLAKNIARKTFFNFLIFFAIFFGIFLPGLSIYGIRD